MRGAELEVGRLRFSGALRQQPQCLDQSARAVSASVRKERCKVLAGHCNRLKSRNKFRDRRGPKAVGAIGFSAQSDVAFRSAEIGYWLGEEFWERALQLRQ